MIVVLIISVAARVFAKFGANVWLAGRDLKKTKDVADSIATNIADASLVHTLELDLSSLSSVRKAASNFLSIGIPLHVLLNNAGCMAIEDKTISVDGFEMQFATNHLGHFLFTNLLIPALLKAAPSRVVSVSSMAHFRSGILFDDPNFKKTPYDAVLLTNLVIYINHYFMISGKHMDNQKQQIFFTPLNYRRDIPHQV